MAKFYSKSDLSFKSGYVVNAEGDVVALPKGVARQLNDIETMVQKGAWVSEHATEAKEPEEFVRKSAFDTTPKVSVDTPELDKEVERIMRLDKELRLHLCADKLNEIIAGFKEAFAFCAEKEFVEGDKVTRLDLPTLGDPLKLTSDSLTAIVASTMLGGDDE